MGGHAAFRIPARLVAHDVVLPIDQRDCHRQLVIHPGQARRLEEPGLGLVVLLPPDVFVEARRATGLGARDLGEFRAVVVWDCAGGAAVDG